MSTVLVEGKYFKVQPIRKVKDFDNYTHKLNTYEEDLSYGLGIERKVDDHHDIVVAFLHSSEEGDPRCVEDVDFRTVDLISDNMSMEDFWEMMQEYKNCVEFARKVIRETCK